MGIQKFDTMMKEMPEAAGLSRKYTNHSVRATAITLGSNAGLSNRHIMAISGHRNEQSSRNCNAGPSSGQLQLSNDVLSNAPSATSVPLHQFRSIHKLHRPRYYPRVPSRFTEMPPSPTCSRDARLAAWKLSSNHAAK